MELFRFEEGSHNTWDVPKAPKFRTNTPEPGSLSVSSSIHPALFNMGDIWYSRGCLWEKRKMQILTQPPTSHSVPNNNAFPQVKTLRTAREAQLWLSNLGYTLPAVSLRVLPGTSWPPSVTSEWSAHLQARFQIHDIPNQLSNGSSACSWLPSSWPTLDEHLTSQLTIKVVTWAIDR